MSVLLTRSVARVGMVGWLFSTLLLGSALLAKHIVALPAPSASASLSRALTPLRDPSERGQWLAVHVLYAECRCSQRIVSHLLSTTRPVDTRELVIWVGDQAPPSGLGTHFRVKRATVAELARVGISAAPLLIVLDPSDGVRYVGGYSARKQGPELEDLQILVGIRNNGIFATLPVFGCAISDRLRQRLTLLTGP